MKNLFQNELPKSLNLSRNISVRSETTTQKEFDLEDKRQNNINILSKGQGDASYQNSLKKELYILDFENLRNQFNSCAILDNENITKRCDYFIADIQDESICIFNELTIIKEEYLTEKENKAKEQLLHSLKCVEKCPDLWCKLNSFSTKICLFSYKIFNNNISVQNSFNKPLEIESDESGIQYPNEEIEELGFEYRRIGYTPFKIT